MEKMMSDILHEAKYQAEHAHGILPRQRWKAAANEIERLRSSLEDSKSESEHLRDENKAAWDSAEYNAQRARDAEKRIEELEAEVERHKRIFTHGSVDRFWRVWDEVGEPHIHGVYESTWGAFRRAFDGEE